jgi:hypothetical protein
MVKRFLPIPHAFICFCGSAEGIDWRVQCRPLIDNLQGWWNKISLFKRNIGLEGQILFLDLDVVIVGDITPIATYDADFIIIKDWWHDEYNSSVFLLKVGARDHVWDKFNPEQPMDVGATDQDFLTRMLPGEKTWPPEWIVSFKNDCAHGIPPNARIVVFHGRPKPHNYPAPWIRDFWNKEGA